jgi:hypothetical protein
MSVCVFVPEILAQSRQPPVSSEGWRVRLTPYVWGSGLEGSVGIGDRSADVNASFADILSELNFAFMTLFEANRDRFTTVTDFVYLNLSDEDATPGPLFSSASAAQKALIVSPTAGYRLIGVESNVLDAFGGIRFWRINGELNFEPGVLPGVELSASRNWLDGLAGLKGRFRLSPAWSASGYADIGGGGSNLTYQVIGAAGVDIGNRYALVFGYRYLNVAYNKDRFLFDTALGGPIVGFTLKF